MTANGVRVHIPADSFRRRRRQPRLRPPHSKRVGHRLDGPLPVLHRRSPTGRARRGPQSGLNRRRPHVFIDVTRAAPIATRSSHVATNTPVPRRARTRMPLPIPQRRTTSSLAEARSPPQPPALAAAGGVLTRGRHCLAAAAQHHFTGSTPMKLKPMLPCTGEEDSLRRCTAWCRDFRRCSRRTRNWSSCSSTFNPCGRRTVDAGQSQAFRTSALIRPSRSGTRLYVEAGENQAHDLCPSRAARSRPAVADALAGAASRPR